MWLEKSGERLAEEAKRRDDVMPISAITGEGLDALRELMASKLRSGEQVHLVRLPTSAGERIAWLHSRGEVLDQKLDRDELELSVRLSAGQLGALSGDGVRLSLLRRSPKLFLLLKRKVREARFLLDRPEPALELAIGIS